MIPMSGTGARFISAGYKEIKPLIPVDNKSMIEHVVNMFPGERDFIFVCNAEHIMTTNLKRILYKLKPGCTIVEIEPHTYGPVYSVLQTKELLKNDEPVIVNYCDFSVYWEYDDFKNKIIDNGFDGSMTAYRGFHPHLLGNGLYAGIRSDKNNHMLEVKEKFSFTKNKMDSYHSAGTYFFKKGAYIKKYFQMVMERNLHIKGEYYVSTVYQLMKEERMRIHIYELDYFLQWGTPEDLQEYVYWSEYFGDKRP